MKHLDVRKKHQVTLTFLLDEEVTPQLFAQKVALACGGAALRLGEAILVPHAKIACVVSEMRGAVSELAATLTVSSFGYEWHSTLKKPRPKKTATRRKSR